ncbi:MULTISPECIES: TRAP transporter permease [unclassified Campylobacter]|uniref:TRAP transporter permease n=1 Tax=unclassified Campylobacter TaxID=2593542 RepID=UPI0022E9BB77|nr:MULTISPECIES: TRAP transporter permease [unclassified Campylobacter]MDA3085903.1 TRAP transporter permease [Campylobacter sp. CS_ED1]MDA3090636.1 TRAP transporter permease [Campylobacter sp. CS_ED2]
MTETKDEKFVEVKNREFTSTKLAYLVTAICFSWSVFQLYLAFSPTNTTIARSIHVAFAVAIIFLYFPFSSKRLSTYVPIYDWILFIVGVLAVLYPALAFYSLSQRPGDYTQFDIIVAFTALIVLFEAGRRMVGPALPIIAGIFLLYCYFGQYMPDLISHQGASIERLAGHMFLTTEGVFGVPVGVSTSFIYLFVLFGALLEKAGAGQYFINVAFALLGKFKGGPAKASVIASGLTGMISGSSTANVATVGTFTIPLMRRSGLTAVKSGAITVAAGVNGQLMPPIMGAAAFIIAEFLGMSYTNVMIAAVIPAFVCYASLVYIVHLESCKLGLTGNDDKLKFVEKLKIILSGIHYLIPVLVLLYTLLIAKESAISAAFNSICVLFVMIVIQEPIRKFIMKEKIEKSDFTRGFSDIFWAMVDAAKNMVTVAIATALAGVIIGSISLTGLGQVLSEIVEAIAGNSIILILLLTAVMSLILGMGLPTTANYIVVSSLIAPVILLLAAKNGFLVPAIAVHMFVFYFGILADDTPPVGIAAYAAAGIAKANPVTVGVQGFIYDLRTALLPFAFFFNNKLLLIESVGDAMDAKSIVWINDPLQICVIFATALLGMFAFSSALQGWFVTKCNAVERILLLAVTPFMVVPNICAKYFSFVANETMSFGVGLAILALVFAKQWVLRKKTTTQTA